MLGLNRTGDWRNGFPVVEPLVFGNPITEPKNFGNPVTLPKNFGNPVTWTVSPVHFCNVIGGVIPPPPPLTSGFELEDGSGVILLESGDILLLEAQ
jgi:hypothetical protein